MGQFLYLLFSCLHKNLRFSTLRENISSVITQTGESQNGGNKKTKHPEFYEKRKFFIPITHMYACISGGKKYSFFGKYFNSVLRLLFEIFEITVRLPSIVFFCEISLFHAVDFKKIHFPFGTHCIKGTLCLLLQLV